MENTRNAFVGPVSFLTAKWLLKSVFKLGAFIAKKEEEYL